MLGSGVGADNTTGLGLSGYGTPRSPNQDAGDRNIGHADLPKKFNYVPKEDCTPLFRKFLEAAKKADCAIELNTAGLRKDCREIYPSSRFLELAFAAGVPITFGSDAHAPGEVGVDFDKSLAAAKAAGYRKFRKFAGRKWTEASLP